MKQPNVCIVTMGGSTYCLMRKPDSDRYIAYNLDSGKIGNEDYNYEKFNSAEHDVIDVEALVKRVTRKT